MNLALFHFIRPYWLLALIPLVIITVLIVKHKLQRGNWVNVCDEALLPYILQETPSQKSKIPLISLNVIATVLTIIALAGPTWERVPSPAFRNDSGLVIALDLSKSMEASDIKPSRLVRARYKIADILKQRKDGQTALLVYTGDAFTVTPLTNDNATIASQLEALTPDIMPSSGSNTVLAVQKAVELFKQAGLQKGQVLLITDGINSNEESAIVQQLGDYQLSVLAVGTEQGAPISLAEGGFLKDESGAIVMPKLPVAELQNLAGAGQGIYQTITDDDSDIKTLLAAVDKSVQKAANAGDNTNNMLLEKWDEKGVWLLLLILPLAALNFRRGLLTIAFLVLLPLPENSYALTWQDLWQTKDQQAYQAYNKGDYDKAAKLFEDPAWQAAAQYKSKQSEIEQLKTPTSATGFYNQGNVLAKAGKYAEAIQAYDQALKQNPDKSVRDDALYNKKLVEEALKKQQEQKQDSQNSQDKNQKNKDQQKQKNKEQKDNKDNKSSQDKKDSKNDKSKKEQQKPENSENKKDQESKEAEDKQQQNQQNQQQKEQEKQQAAQAKKQQSEKEEQKAQAQQAQLQQDEKKRADDEWLKRIPDDPAGLLRRKFKYQYQQRQQQNTPTQNW
jgi:Ca-activated chloride channel family protein